MTKVYENDNLIAPSWAKEDPTIFNVALTDADTEYSQLLPDGTKAFSVSIRGAADTDNYRLAWVTGKVATPTAPYMQYLCTVEKYEDNLCLNGATMYIACSAAGKVAQIECWK